MRLLPTADGQDVDQRFQHSSSAGAERSPFQEGRSMPQITHCFASPDSSHTTTRLLDSFTCQYTFSPFTLRSPGTDCPVAYDMADQSPFAKLLRSTLKEEATLPPGRCSSPEMSLPEGHVQRVILPRIRALLSPASTPVNSSASLAPPASVSSNAANEQQQEPASNTYPEHQQLNDLMHVIQQHAANPIALKENAAELADELRAVLRISATSSTALGPTPDADARPTQFICACLHRSNLLFILADLLFTQHASVDPDTGFGLANSPAASNPEPACVKEAEAHLKESLELHDKAMEVYRSSCPPPASPRASVSSPTRSAGPFAEAGEACGVPIAAATDLTEQLRSTRFVQPRAKVMLRYALVQAALGKREPAVETLHEISGLDPWIPELELMPPEVAHAHRVSVEQAKGGLVWYYNSNHDALRANRFRDDAIIWKMRRMSQEVNTEWEPADVLPRRGGSAGTHTHKQSCGRTSELFAPALSEQDAVSVGSRSAPLPRHTAHFRVPQPARDPQAGKRTPEQHVLKLLRDADDAGDKELSISILARAIEHGAATTSMNSLAVLEPLIEHSYHIVSAANLTGPTTGPTAVHLILHALAVLREGELADAGGSGSSSASSSSAPSPPSVISMRTHNASSAADAAIRLRLRRRAVHALAVAMHQQNRVSEPLSLHRRALALALQQTGDPESVATLEPRCHIVALSIARLYMLSTTGAEDLARVADRPDCCEGAWKTTYGRGRPGRSARFYQPVVERDNDVEVTQTTRWLHQHLQMGVRTLCVHLLRLANASAERLQNLPEPSSSSHFPPRLTSPLPSRTPSATNLPQISEAEAESVGSQWGGDTDDLAVDSGTDVATGASAPEELPSESEVSHNHGSRGIFRNVSQKSRVLKIGTRSATSCALLAAVEEDNKSWTVEELVNLLKSTCEEADSIAKEAQARSGFAVSQPPWVAHLCIPHWRVVHTLLSSELDIASPSKPLPGTPLFQLTEQLSQVLAIFTEYFCESAPFNDGDSDVVLSLDLCTPHQARATSPSPLRGTPMGPISDNTGASSARAPGMSAGVTAPAEAPPPNVYLPPDNIQPAPSSPLQFQPAAGLDGASVSAGGPSAAPLAPLDLSQTAMGSPSSLRTRLLTGTGDDPASRTEVPKQRHGAHKVLCLRLKGATPQPPSTPATAHRRTSTTGGPPEAVLDRSNSNGASGSPEVDTQDMVSSAFDIGTHRGPLQQPLPSPRALNFSTLESVFAQMYHFVDCGVERPAEDAHAAHATDPPCSPTAVSYLFPKIFHSLPFPQPSPAPAQAPPQQVPHQAGAQQGCLIHLSPTSGAPASPTPHSSLRLSYRSGSLSITLPPPDVALPKRLPKPTVESFGLEQDAQTSVSLGPTPIPCILQVAKGPSPASEVSGSPTAATATAAGSDRDAEGALLDRSSRSASTAVQSVATTMSCAALPEPSLMEGSGDSEDPTQGSRADNHTPQSPPSSPPSMLAPSGGPCAVPDGMLGARHPATSAPSANAADQQPSTPGHGGHSAPVVIPQSSAASPQAEQPACVAPSSAPTLQSIPNYFSSSTMEADLSSSLSIATTAATGSPPGTEVPYAMPSQLCPLSHIFGAGGTSFCAAALSDPVFATAVAPGSPPGSTAPCSDTASASPEKAEAHARTEHPVRDSRAPPQTTTSAREADANPPGGGDGGRGWGWGRGRSSAAVPVRSCTSEAAQVTPPAALGASLMDSRPALVAVQSCWHTPEHEMDSVEACSPCSVDAATEMALGGSGSDDDDFIGGPGDSLEAAQPPVAPGDVQGDAHGLSGWFAFAPPESSTARHAVHRSTMSMPALPALEQDAAVPNPVAPAAGFATGCAPPRGPFGGTAAAVPRAASPPVMMARSPSPPSSARHRAGGVFQFGRSGLPGVGAVGRGRGGLPAEEECGALLSKDAVGDAGGTFARPDPAASAPELAAACEGGPLGSVLWGRNGPNSTAGHLRARSVCLDSLGL